MTRAWQSRRSTSNGMALGSAHKHPSGDRTAAREEDAHGTGRRSGAEHCGPAPSGRGAVRLVRAGDGQAHGVGAHPVGRRCRPRSSGPCGRSRTAQADIARITKADFPLPTLAPKLARICDEVLNGRGFVLMRGPAGGAMVDPRGGDRLLRHRRPLRQRPLAEREGARARPRARPRPQRHQGPDRARLPDARAPDLSHRLLRHRRPAVPQDGEVGRGLGAGQLDDHL